MIKSKYGNRKRVMVKDFEIAETLVVKIPVIDREKCDLNRIPVMVISKCGKLQPKYALACRYGRIQGLFTSLVIFPGNLIVIRQKMLH